MKRPGSAYPLLPYVSHEQPFVRAAVLRALRQLCCIEALAPALLALTDESPSVRREAVGVLAYLKQPRALHSITALAMYDPDVEVRRAATGALSFATYDEVLPALIHALSDSAWQVREEAAATLGKLGSVHALAEADRALVRALDDPYWQVRVVAARSVGRLRVSAAVPALIDALSHAISNLRKQAAIALGEIGDGRAIPALQSALEDSDADVRKLAHLALSQIAGSGVSERETPPCLRHFN